MSCLTPTLFAGVFESKFTLSNLPCCCDATFMFCVIVHFACHQINKYLQSHSYFAARSEVHYSVPTCAPLSNVPSAASLVDPLHSNSEMLQFTFANVTNANVQLALFLYSAKRKELLSTAKSIFLPSLVSSYPLPLITTRDVWSSKRLLTLIKAEQSLGSSRRFPPLLLH